MRVALLCPYSLSRPGGVQGQVLGLARALVNAGHDAVVLAPCDGDVEVAGLAPGAVIGLGRSVALPANGSVAPVALSPGAALRAVRAVRRGNFDVLHMHEPLAPGPGYACLVACDLPKVGTFHRAGNSIAYRLLGPVARAAAGRLSARCAVSSEAEATARAALGGTYDIIGNGIDLERFASARPSPTEGPTVLFVGRHEERKGLGVLLEAVSQCGHHKARLLFAQHAPGGIVLGGEDEDLVDPAGARLGEDRSEMVDDHRLVAGERGEPVGDDPHQPVTAGAVGFERRRRVLLVTRTKRAGPGGVGLDGQEAPGKVRRPVAAIETDDDPTSRQRIEAELTHRNGDGSQSAPHSRDSSRDALPPLIVICRDGAHRRPRVGPLRASHDLSVLRPLPGGARRDGRRPQGPRGRRPRPRPPDRAGRPERPRRAGPRSCAP